MPHTLLFHFMTGSLVFFPFAFGSNALLLLLRFRFVSLRFWRSPCRFNLATLRKSLQQKRPRRGGVATACVLRADPRWAQL